MASTAEDDERGAAVYEEYDDDDSDDGADTDEEYDDDAAAEGRALALPPPPPPAAPLADQQLPHSLSSVSNPSPYPSASAPIPQNGGGGSVAFVASPDGKRQRMLLPGEERKRLAAAHDESRRLFQKLWTDADEIAILQGFLEFTSQRGTTHANYQHDTGPFYDQIKNRLQVDFNKNQLVEKLRRLKKKYRNMVNRMGSGKEFVFKSPHDKATFEIARKIWSPSFKRTRSRDSGNAPNPQLQESSNLVPVEIAEDVSLSSDHMISRPRRRSRRRSEGAPEMDVPMPTPVVSIPVLNHTPFSSAPIPNANLIEQTVKSCLSPLFKELLQYAMGGPCAPVGAGDAGAPLNPLLLNIAGGSGAVQADEKWRKQQILELEVYLKRVELVREQIKSKLEVLRSMGSS
ncbi:probable transcription factor At3g04930 [Phoenix dactylifera]|uniref:Probable transcription factor At3g04930 n=1 Tax=Phoenix dactylifera TaxID=42345 RepID=A0A8B7CW75_PHODC|nr:probable transcription factor At3g04930 [Phoenix dactylifera]